MTMKTSLMILIGCAGLLLSGGSILGCTSIWCMLRMSYYFWLTDLGVELTYNVLYIAGALLSLPSCWFITLVPYHSRSLSIMACLMCLLTGSMIMLSSGLSASTAMSQALRDPGAINQSLHRAMVLEEFDPAVRSSFKAMQLELQCCGINSYNDWVKFRGKIPPACCGRITNGKYKIGRDVELCSNPVYKNPCLPAVLNELRNQNNTLAILASLNIFVSALALFTAAYTLVSNSLERSRSKNVQGHAVRIACLSATPISIPTSLLTGDNANKYLAAPRTAFTASNDFNKYIPEVPSGI